MDILLLLNFFVVADLLFSFSEEYEKQSLSYRGKGKFKLISEKKSDFLNKRDTFASIDDIVSKCTHHLCYLQQVKWNFLSPIHEGEPETLHKDRQADVTVDKIPKLGSEKFLKSTYRPVWR